MTVQMFKNPNDKTTIGIVCPNCGVDLKQTVVITKDFHFKCETCQYETDDINDALSAMKKVDLPEEEKRK
jgi:DNA-directed RNA polymerase subunit RPC12/RpoP